MLRGSLVVAFLIFASPRVQSQDLFEIQVYEYETVGKGKWNLETHFNHITRGTKSFEGTVAPTNHQFHLTWELTRGITENFEMAGYLVTAQRPGGGYEFGGWRLRPRVRAPQRWELPVDLSLSFEMGFPRPQYEANSVTFELRPIVEKELRRMRLSFNPVLARALRGPDTKDGFEFEPNAKFAYFIRKKDWFNVGMEYYGATGPITGFHRLGEQVHILVPSADIFFNEHTMVNLGAGFGLTSAGERLILKMRLGYRF